MFGKFFQSKTTVTKPALIPDRSDLSFGLPIAADAATLLQQLQFSALKKLYEEATIEDRTFILDKCCLTNQWQHQIETWSLAEPDDFYSNLFHAVLFTFKAWEARTAVVARHVSTDSAMSFADYLEEALGMLQHCQELRGDAEVPARTIRVAMGLSEPDLGRECFEKMAKIYRGHIHGHMFLFNLLTPKWFGNLEDIAEFTEQSKEIMEEHPGLLIILLMELAEKHYVIQDDSRKTALLYIQEQRQVIDQYNQWAKNRVIHPSYRNYINNYFAYLYHVCKEPGERDAIINSLDPSIPLYPWGYLGINTPKEFWRYWKT
jgi:hypothetical protein